MMEDFTLPLLVIAVLGALFLVYRHNQKQRALKVAALAEAIRRFEHAQKRYATTLFLLKASPSDANAKQTALDAGRRLAKLSRENGAETIFDEMVLMNDINAACAGATAAPVAPDIEARLKKIEGLRVKKIIDQTEYARRREQILLEI